MSRGIIVRIHLLWSNYLGYCKLLVDVVFFLFGYRLWCFVTDGRRALCVLFAFKIYFLSFWY